MKIYFAHPAFTDTQRAFKARFLNEFEAVLKKRCANKGTGVPAIIDPFDYSPTIEKDPQYKERFSRSVASLCCRLLRDCFLVVAVADDHDNGVAFELGFAHALNIPAITVSEGGAADETNAMLFGTSEARISHVLEHERMAVLADMVYGFSMCAG